MYSPKKKNDKVDILGVQFDNVTMLDMVENVKHFLKIIQMITCLL